MEIWLAIVSSAATILAAIVVVWGGATAYRGQKTVDRSEQLIAKRREIYRDLLVAISKSVTTQGPEANVAYQTAKSEAFVYGSDAVVKAIKPLSDLLEGREPGTADDQLKAYAVLVHAMRADSFEGSKLSIGELSRLTPFTPALSKDD